MGKTGKKTSKKIKLKKIPWRQYLGRFNYTGLVIALVFFCLSLLPSLLPRPWLYQGIISGFSVAIGYGIGVFVSFATRWITEMDVPKKFKRYAWRILAVVAPLSIIIFLYLGSVWQSEVRTLVSQTSAEHSNFLGILLLAGLVSWTLIVVARGLRRLTQIIGTKLDAVLPRRVSFALGIVIVVGVIYWVISGVFLNFLITQANNIYARSNAQTPNGVSQPTSIYRSGSQESVISWEDIGRQGRTFVGQGPNTDQIASFTGQSAKEPIRIYTGLKNADSATDRAKLAVADLKRTGAFDRKILVLATATGTGWIEPQAADSIEYMYGGDSAIVTQQYSYLPSWISFLVDGETATAAGQALYDAVLAEWSQLPKDHRPKLIAYGLSLGSYGAQTAYSGVNDLRLSIDGAVFVGTPNHTRLWRTITDNRDAGSPEWLPSYKDGKTVRFAATNDDINRYQQPWQFPRVLYLQHASDPVVWFSFDLIHNKPDWLSEKRGSDVSPAMQWYPFVTFFQVAVDQFFGTSVPSGHGHNYYESMVDAWAAVAPPDNWTAQKSATLRDIIAKSE